MDAIALSQEIIIGRLSDCDIPPWTEFHRIHVSNVVDANYAGLREVVTNWAPFLAETRGAIMIGYFMNWVALQDDGRVQGLGEKRAGEIIGRILRDNKEVRDDFMFFS